MQISLLLDLLYFAFMFLVGYIGYRESQQFKRQNGFTPWHLPSIVWGILAAFFLLLTAVLLSIAKKTTKPPNVGYRNSQNGGGFPYSSTGQGNFGNGPFNGQNPYNSGVPINHIQDSNFHPGSYQVQIDPRENLNATQGAPEPRWLPDPTNRHQLRYWDGTRWSEHVSSNGVQGIDHLT